MIRRALGEVIRAYCKENGCKLEDLGLNVGHLSRIQNGKKSPGITYLEKLAEKMGMRYDDLARDVRRMKDRLEHPEPRSSEILVSTSLLQSDGILIFDKAGVVDYQNVEDYSRRFFQLGREYGVTRILINSLRLDFSEEERYRATFAATQMGKALGYQPKVAMLTDLAGDEYGLEICRDHDQPAYPFSRRRRRDALKFLRSE